MQILMLADINSKTKKVNSDVSESVPQRELTQIKPSKT